jgi:hypothetical protein
MSYILPINIKVTIIEDNINILCNKDRMTLALYYINVREYRRGNKKRIVHRNRQYRVHKTNTNPTQYVLDTTMHKHRQIT